MDSRRDRLAAQKAQVALVFQKMLGKDEARAYLIENNFAESTIDRILNGDATRKRASTMRNGGSATLRGKASAPAYPTSATRSAADGPHFASSGIELKHRLVKA